eukprot:TRINITY_DN12147_c0_g1_i1.p1 TRINITY_DN12147_c0_g1~~TRINITY_DN12147_c0_g1_i1.p1  ORF type:complete len:54 (+),score=10.60 TRINITY_DN12147_c0_g1_i1:234-395(+)
MTFSFLSLLEGNLYALNMSPSFFLMFDSKNHFNFEKKWFFVSKLMRFLKKIFY